MTHSTPIKPKVLVLGGSGFVGQHTVSNLLHAGHSVIATTTNQRANLPTGVNLSWVEWDATVSDLPDINWDEIDVILHLAIPSSLANTLANAEQTYEIIVTSTLRLLTAAKNNNVKRFVLASTGDVLGSRPEPALESDLTYCPDTFYGTTKACAELLINAFSNDLSTAVLRFFHPYGPNGDKFLIGNLVDRITSGKPVYLEGYKGILLNPIWIEDLSQGIRLAVDSSACGVFHFGGSETVHLAELIELIGKLTQKKPIIEFIEKSGQEFHCGNWERSRNILHFEPRVSLREGLAQIVKKKKFDIA